ncbi:MAG TPA: sugar phosphate nucleotidyltransferase [bacterium]
MNVIIPVAGEGVRLKPHTHMLPKSLLHVAGNTILGHILESLKPLKISRVVIVLGSKADEITSFCRNYPVKFKFQFVTQHKRLGLGHAIHTGARGLNGPTLVLLGDTIIDHNLKIFCKADTNMIAVKKVADPRRFGIVEVSNKNVVNVVEKPEIPPSNLAIVGLYFFRKIEKVHQALDHIIKKNIRTKGEYQLTDGLKRMIQQGERFKTVSITHWFDCGTPDAMIDTNRHLLKTTHYFKKRKTAAITSPVYISDSAVVINSIIGPDVSISANVFIRDSIIKDSIINRDAVIENSLLSRSIIGQNAVVKSSYKKLNVGDHSVIELP